MKVVGNTGVSKDVKTCNNCFGKRVDTQGKIYCYLGYSTRIDVTNTLCPDELCPNPLEFEDFIIAPFQKGTLRRLLSNL